MTATDAQDSSQTEHYRGYVGPAERYDVAAATQFNLLTFLGLREQHYLLDIGCGSLRAGRLFIPYLLAGRYFGIEPDRSLIDQGIERELGRDVLDVKHPTFSTDAGMTLSTFGREFDFVLANSIFSHATQQQISRCLAEAKRALAPDGIFAASFYEGDDDYEGTEWVYPNCVKYTRERMIALADEQGLACRSFEWPHPGNQRWLLITHPENENAPPDASDALLLAIARDQLKQANQRLYRLENHPYVRIGLGFRRGLSDLLARLTRLGRAGG